MLTLIKRSSLLLLLPATALAAPVTITSHSTGMIEVDRTMALALDADQLQSAGKVPYELTLTSSFDWSRPLPGRGQGADDPAQVVVDFRLADVDYHYAGQGTFRAQLDGNAGATDSYAHQVGFLLVNPKYVPAFTFYFTNDIVGPAGSLGSGALAPSHMAGIGPEGSLQVEMGYVGQWGNYELFYMNGDVATSSVAVTSLVPEPAAYGLLAVGLLTLGLRRRART